MHQSNQEKEKEMPHCTLKSAFEHISSMTKDLRIFAQLNSNLLWLNNEACHQSDQEKLFSCILFLSGSTMSQPKVSELNTNYTSMFHIFHRLKKSSPKFNWKAKTTKYNLHLTT
jgi:hypothetical protein